MVINAPVLGTEPNGSETLLAEVTITEGTQTDVPESPDLPHAHSLIARALRSVRRLQRALPEGTGSALQEALGPDDELTRWSEAAAMEFLLQLMDVQERVMREYEEHLRESRLDPETIEAVTATSEATQDTIAQGGTWGQRMCVVCLEDFSPGHQLRTLPCEHRFHKECIDQWFSQSGHCPVCVRSLRPRAAAA